MGLALTKPSPRRLTTMLALSQAERKLTAILINEADTQTACQVQTFQGMLDRIKEQHERMRADTSLETIPLRTICASVAVLNVLARAGIYDVIDVGTYTSIEARKMMKHFGRPASRFGIISLIPDRRST